MAIVMDATAGGAAANSYNTLAEANDYFEALAWFSPQWADLDPRSQGQLLIEAARSLDTSFCYRGAKNDATTPQALEFPRDIQPDPATVPTKVKHAQLEMVLAQWNQRGNAFDGASGQAEAPVKEVEVAGKIRIEFAGSSAAPADEGGILGGSLARVRALLREWILRGAGASGRSLPLVR